MCGKSFFQIPNPTKSAEKRILCKQWIKNLENDKLKFETFIFNTSKVVCEDHFTADSFDRNLVAESLNFKPMKKRLLPNAVPTLINTTIRKRRKAKNMGKYCTIGDKKKKDTDTQTGEKKNFLKKKKYKRVLPLTDNVKSNNDEVKTEGVTSSSLAVDNKIHVDQETQTIEGTHFPIFLGQNMVWAFVPGSTEGNSSHCNSTSHLLNDQVSVPSLQAKNQETDRLNEDQSIEPQLDNTDDCLTVLSNTMNRLEDLGVEIAAWILVPQNDKTSTIHHMGSQKGREFIKSKPVISVQLHVFMKNSQKKGLDKDQQTDNSIQEDLPMNAPCLVISRNKKEQTLKRKISPVYMGLDDDSSCFKDQHTDDSIQEDLPMNTPCLVISRNKKEQTLKRKISPVYMGDHMHAYCKKKPSKLWHTLLDDSRQPTSSNSRPAIDKDTFTKAKEIDLLKSFKFKNEEQESSSVVHSSTADKSNLEISGDNLINKIKEEPVDYAFQNVKPREIVTKSTVRVDTHSRTAEKSNLEISADNLSIHNIKEERVDCELLYFKDANHNNHVTESTAQLDTHLSTAKKSTVRLKEDLISDRTKEEPADYEFQEVKHRKIVELDSPELSEILQTDDFGIRLRDYECSNCNSNVVEIVNTEQSYNDDFGIRSKFDKETTECFKCDPNLVGTIEGYNVFLNNANESVHHVTSSL